MDSLAINCNVRRMLDKAYEDLRQADEDLSLVQDGISQISDQASPFTTEKKTPYHLVENATTKSPQNNPGDEMITTNVNNENPPDPGASTTRYKHDLGRLIGLRSSLEKIRAHLQQHVNELYRQSLWSCHILELPDEILCGIFGHLENVPNGASTTSYPATKDIQNCRLTCRRFFQTSSQFFLRSVSVQMTEPSLARLEAIARYPTLRKHVQTVRIVMQVHELGHGDGFDHFLRDLTWTITRKWSLRRRVRNTRDSTCTSETNGFDWDYFDDKATPWDGLRNILRHGERNGGEDEAIFVSILRQIHAEYRKLYDEQSELKYEGGVRRVTHAITCMKRVQMLHFIDRGPNMHHILSIQTPQSINGPIYEDVLGPENKYSESDESDEFHFLIYAIPVALGQARGYVKDISIQLSSVDEEMHLWGIPWARFKSAKVARGLKDLDRFSVECND